MEGEKIGRPEKKWKCPPTRKNAAPDHGPQKRNLPGDGNRREPSEGGGEKGGGQSIQSKGKSLLSLNKPRTGKGGRHEFLNGEGDQQLISEKRSELSF